MVKKIGKWILLAALFGALLYAVVYFMGSRGDAFKFAEQAIRNSQSLQAQIGKIERVRLAPSGPYKERLSVSGDGWATMMIEVTGATKTVALDVKMKKTNGVWAIEQASLDGKPVTLN